MADTLYTLTRVLNELSCSQALFRVILLLRVRITMLSNHLENDNCCLALKRVVSSAV